NVDDAGRMHAVLRRQRAGDQPHAADEGALNNLRETGNAIWQQNSVYPILNVGVLVANVKIALARGVLVGARKLQNQVAELNGVCLRDLLDIPRVQLVVTGASLWQDDAVAPLIEVLGPPHDLLVDLQLDLLGGRRGRWGGWGRRARRTPSRPRCRAPRG